LPWFKPWLEKLPEAEKQTIIESYKALVQHAEQQREEWDAQHQQRQLPKPTRKATPKARGEYFEWRAFVGLQAHGHTAQMQLFHAPYDILVDGLWRIDVKGSKAYSDGHFWFNLRSRKHKLDCDFLMLGCEGDAVEWLIMPIKAVGSRQGMLVASDFGKWLSYREAWHHLDAAKTGKDLEP